MIKDHFVASARINARGTKTLSKQASCTISIIDKNIFGRIKVSSRLAAKPDVRYLGEYRSKCVQYTSGFSSGDFNDGTIHLSPPQSICPGGVHREIILFNNLNKRLTFDNRIK